LSTPKQERFASIALGFVAGLSVALTYVALTVPEFRDSIQAITGLAINGTDSLAQWIMAVTSVASTISIVLVWLAFQETRKGNAIAKQASDEALAHAQKVFDEEYRPYVFFTDTDALNGNDFDIRKIDIRIKNFGKGLAKDVGVGSESRFFPKIPKVKRFPHINDGFYRPTVRLMPYEQTVTIVYDGVFSEEDIDRIKFSEDLLWHLRLFYNWGDKIEHDELFLLIECTQEHKLTIRQLATAEIMHAHEERDYWAQLPAFNPDDQGPTLTG
jgi:hypothetical protein